MDKYEEGTMYVNGEDTSYFSEADYENIVMNILVLYFKIIT